MRNNLGGKYQHLVPHSGCACHQPDVQNLTNRVTADLSRRGFLAGMAGSVASLGLPGFAKAQTQPSVPTGPILFTNLRLFDGISTDLRSGIQILVEGSRITALDAGNNPPPANAKSIDYGGRVLMPGLIDAHWHTMLAAPFADTGDRRCRIHTSLRERRSRADPDARLYDRSRHGWSFIRA